MAENLPKLREEIKEISMSDLKDFLESIRKHSDKVGETAMRQVREFVFCSRNTFEKVFINSLISLSLLLALSLSLSLSVSVKAQQHRTFNSAVAKQASIGHYTKPVYSLNGRTRTHTHNGLMIVDDTSDEEGADEEVRKGCV